MHKQKIQYLSSDKLLYPFQFGFRQKKSTQDALIYFTESILKHVDNNESIHSECINLSKAFDYVAHQTSMDKLKLIGFNDNALTLNFSFLSHRREQIVINNTVSNFSKPFKVYREEQYLAHYFLTPTITILQNTSRKNAELSNTPITVRFTQRIQNLILNLRVYKSVSKT